MNPDLQVYSILSRTRSTYVCMSAPAFLRERPLMLRECIVADTRGRPGHIRHRPVFNLVLRLFLTATKILLENSKVVGLIVKPAEHQLLWNVYDVGITFG